MKFIEKRSGMMDILSVTGEESYLVSRVTSKLANK